MKNVSSKVFAVLAGAVIMASSCSKNNDVAAPSLSLNSAKAWTPAASGDSINLHAVGTYAANTVGFNKYVSGVFSVRDFSQGTVTAPADSTMWSTVASTYYFNLRDNTGGSSSITGSYDILFTGSANGDLRPNTAVAGVTYTIAYVDEAFSTVDASDYNASNVRSSFGYNNGSSIGWYNYDISVHIMTAVAGRTFIVKRVVTTTSATTYYKIRIKTLYHGGAPNAPFAATNYPYYWFDYQAI
jgi:hypothetical protein